MPTAAWPASITLTIGAYLVLVKWQPILNDVLHAETLPLQWLFAILWYGLFIFDLLAWSFALLGPLRR